MKKLVSLVLMGAMGIGLLSGCAQSPAATTTEGGSGEIAEGGETETPVEQQTIEFWYHDGNPTSTPIYEELIRRFEEKNPQYKVNYVGLPADSYLQKYNTAIATNAVPDIMSILDMNVSALTSQNALMNLEEAYAEFEEKDYINEGVIQSARNYAKDGELYCVPEYVTADVSWVNTAALEENQIEAPVTMDEFMQYCEEYADPQSGKYFYSLRGGAGSLENMLNFIFTYADQSEFFDEEGNSVFDQPIFAEALDAYASIYWNGWTSQDSITNSFKEMVAEFGSETSMYINHNASSLAEHKKNLGDGNFTNLLSPVNENGNLATKSASFMAFAVLEKAKNKEGAIVFLEYLTSAEAASYICQEEGRIPINSLIFEEEWYKNDPYMKVYEEMMASDNVKFVTHPMWLTEWGEFRSKLQEPGLQAVLLKEETSEEVLAEWAEYLTNAQKAYLAEN